LHVFRGRRGVAERAASGASETRQLSRLESGDRIAMLPLASVRERGGLELTRSRMRTGMATFNGRTSIAPPTLEIYSLGIVDYPSVLRLQDRIAYEIAGRGDALGTALVCEHPPAVSIGREGGYQDLRVPPEEFSRRLIDIHWVPRGGGNLVHAPGQLGVYLILPLRRLGCGVREYRQRLSAVLERTCREFRVPVKSSRDGCLTIARTGAVGFVCTAVKSWVTNFGLYLNVEPDLTLLRLCANAEGGARTSSLVADRMRHLSMAGIREALTRHLAEQFGYSKTHFYTAHPLLTRTTKRVHVNA
jgi:lipoyl(octanoyl) transferase